MKHIRLLLLTLIAASLTLSTAFAQKKPKRAVKDSDAQRAIAATPGFALNKGAVKVRNASLVGETPIVVTADVEVALGFEQTKAEKGEVSRWRAVEFRTGDRTWERFDYFVGPLSAQQVEGARALLEEMAFEFEARQRERKKAEEKESGGREEKKKDKSEEAKDEEAKDGVEKVEAVKGDEKKVEVRRGPLLMKEFSPMYKSARAIVAVEATFRLEKGSGKNKWQVVGFQIGDTAFGNIDALVAAINRRKAARALEDLERVRAALEDYRRERGFYVVSDSETVLIDHLNPLYLKTIIRVDPWNRSYRYTGTRERFTLSSDGPDGLPLTADDVTLNGPRV